MATLGNTSSTYSYERGVSDDRSCAAVLTNNTGSDILVSSITFYQYDNNDGWHGKGVIWNSTGSTVLAVGSITNIIPGSWPLNPRYWLTSNVSYTMTNGTSYLVGVVCDTSTAFYGNTSTGKDMFLDTANSYTTPNDFNKSATYSNTEMLIYITYTAVASGPAITVEGFTPASAESVLWANITGIK
jgi:hypothetical protein